MENEYITYQLILDDSKVQTFANHLWNIVMHRNCLVVKNEKEITGKIYSSELAAFLCLESFPVEPDNEKQDTRIDGRKYLETYIKGFSEGKEFFKNNYTVPPGIRYDDRYISDLYVQYNGTGHNGHEGWNFVKSGYPITISNDIIKEWGYYAGIVSEYEELKRSYPVSFEKLEIEIRENTDPESPKTFITKYTNSELDTIRKRLIKSNIVKNISKSDFVYLFTGQSIKEKMMKLEWKESRPLAHNFLLRVVYCDVHFNYNQVNECIIFRENKILDSNNKSTAKYKNDDILNPILSI